MSKRSDSNAGFTLMEVGISIAVVAMLMVIVLSARGMIDAARTGAALKMGETIREASREWAKRNRNGLDFNGLVACTPGTGGGGNPAANLPGFACTGAGTAWGAAQYQVNGAAAGCAGNSCIQIRIPLRDQAMCQDLLRMVNQWSGVQLGGATLCEPGGATPAWLRIVTR
jgi:type II secretory pathway pseudopilin PulG